MEDLQLQTRQAAIARMETVDELLAELAKIGFPKLQLSSVTGHWEVWLTLPVERPGVSAYISTDSLAPHVRPQDALRWVLERAQGIGGR